MVSSMTFFGSWGPRDGEASDFADVERELTLSDGMRIRLKPGQGIRTVHRPDGSVDTYVGTRSQLREYEERFRAMERGEE